MPLALVLAGLVLFIATIRGSLHDDHETGLFDLLKKDFTDPQGNFLMWILAIGLVGSVGYVKQLRPVANAFLVLILIVFILAANKGGRDFFSSLLSQMRNRTITLGA